jgi:threonine/homoserine/homoserine lactone efflux protein
LADQAGDADASDGRQESANQKADRNWAEILQELRVSQTGTQILSGFLLTVAFQPRFTQLDTYQVVVYAVLVVLAAVSTALGLATVALHRARFRQHDKPRLVSVASRLLGVTVITVAVLTTGVLLLIFDVVLGRSAGLIAGVVAALVMVVLLVFIPSSVKPGRRAR